MRVEWLWIALTALLVGCGEQPPRPAAPGAPPPATGQAAAPIDQEDAVAEAREAAKAGVGQKGRQLDDAGAKVVSEPARQYFRLQERLVFEVQIPSALNVYKAQEGRPPQDHEEFMEKIIRANHIQLPELPPGRRYLYDPEAEELMVERR